MVNGARQPKMMMAMMRNEQAAKQTIRMTTMPTMTSAISRHKRRVKIRKRVMPFRMM